MNFPGTNRRMGAFTLVEMLVVIGIIAILAALLLPALTGAKARAKRIACESQLREQGLAFHSFAHDHNSKFPMAVPSADGGSLEFAQNAYLVNGNFYFGYKHFQTLAGLLQSPSMLVCPADTRPVATNFAALLNTNISYFVNLTADCSQPMSLLSGDGNLTSASTLSRVSTGAALTWTAEQHRFKGNVLFSDGHVEEWGRGANATLSQGGDFSLPTPGSGPASTASVFSPAGSGRSPSPASLPSMAGSPSPSAEPSPAKIAPSSDAPMPARTDVKSAPVSAARPSATAVVENTNLAVTPAPRTNPPVQIFSTPVDDDAGMTVFDRKAAKFFQHVIGGSYLLLLLLFLAFLIWRIRRWLKERAQRRK